MVINQDTQSDCDFAKAVAPVVSIVLTSDIVCLSNGCRNNADLISKCFIINAINIDFKQLIGVDKTIDAHSAYCWLRVS